MVWNVEQLTGEQNKVTMSSAEMIVLGWMSAVTRGDIVRNEYVRDSTGVTSIVDKTI